MPLLFHAPCLLGCCCGNGYKWWLERLWVSDGAYAFLQLFCVHFKSLVERRAPPHHPAPRCPRCCSLKVMGIPQQVGHPDLWGSLLE